MTLFDLATRYVGQVLERPGGLDHPLIQWWLSLCGFGHDARDETPWCAAFVNGMAWELRLPRSKSAAARSWLTVGRPIPLGDARAAWDVVVLKRGKAPQPGPEVTSGAPGHVGLFAGLENGDVLLLGGNQRNGVTIARFPVEQVLGVRRLDGV